MEVPRILIVDDEHDARRSVTNYLRRHLECDLHYASGGREALALLDGGGFDIILLDIKMPGISGLDVLRNTRRTQPATDIIVITGYANPALVREILEAGAIDCILKPSPMGVIFEKVCALLKKRDKFLPKEPDGVAAT